MLGAARGGAHPEVHGGCGAEAVLELQQPLVEKRCAGLRLGEARLVAARHELQLVRGTRREWRQQDRIVVDGDDPLPAADLLLEHVAQEAAPHRAGVVRGEALPLARDQGGHEVERVELRVGVLERRARGRPLVHHHVHAGGIGVRPRARPPARDGALELRRVELRDRCAVLGGVDDHLVVPGRGAGHQQLGVAAAARERILGRPPARPAPAAGTCSAPRARSSRACRARRRRVARRRSRAESSSRAPRTAGTARVHPRDAGRLEAEGPVRPCRRQHDPQTRERVDPKLRCGHSAGLPALVPAAGPSRLR